MTALALVLLLIVLASACGLSVCGIALAANSGRTPRL